MKWVYAIGLLIKYKGGKRTWTRREKRMALNSGEERGVKAVHGNLVDWLYCMGGHPRTMTLSLSMIPGVGETLQLQVSERKICQVGCTVARCETEAIEGEWLLVLG
jgi:hypothetical protein